MHMDMSQDSHVTREFSSKISQIRWIPCPRPTVRASLCSRNARAHVTRAILRENSQVKCCRPRPRPTLCASLRSRNAHGHLILNRTERALIPFVLLHPIPFLILHKRNPNSHGVAPYLGGAAGGGSVLPRVSTRLAQGRAAALRGVGGSYRAPRIPAPRKREEDTEFLPQINLHLLEIAWFTESKVFA